MVVGLSVVVGLLHVLVVSHRYFVGSFDDDANYILTAKALLAGQGLAGHLSSGDAVVGGYPPGYPVLLVPLLWLFPHSFVPLRLLSAAFFAAMFPLAWYYLGRRGFPEPVRAAVMVLLALNPVLATFGSMVMAELPFICCALLLLIAADRWEATARVLCPTGVVVILLGVAAVWLKEAGIGVTLGLALWLALRHRLAHAAGVVGGLVVLLAPVVVARLADHVPLAGARYSQELGAYYAGGLPSRLLHVLPHGALTYLDLALPRSVVEFGVPLPQGGPWYTLIRIVWLQIPVFTILGLIVTAVRYRDAAVLAVPAYTVETLLWPQVNERRVILVLPVLLAWYALGVWTAARWLLGRTVLGRSMPGRSVPGRTVPGRTVPAQAMPARAMPARAMPARAMPARAMLARAMPARSEPARSVPARSGLRRWLPPWTPPTAAVRAGRRGTAVARSARWPRRASVVATAVLGIVVVIAPLLAQFPRDYLFGIGQDSSRPQGSRYMALLRAAGVPRDVVETDYRYTTALLSGHRTADGAFLAEIRHVTCSAAVARTALAGDRAAYLLIGAVNKPNRIDNPCLFSLATTEGWAVRLLRTSRDHASVFELIGPGTAHPDLVDLLAGRTPTGSGGLRTVAVASAGAGDHPGSADTTAIEAGRATFTWAFGAATAVRQVAVGEAGTTVGVAAGVALQLERPDGSWVTVSSAPAAVGDGPDHRPFLLATLPSGTEARAVRVVVHGSGQAIALDVTALGATRRTP